MGKDLHEQGPNAMLKTAQPPPKTQLASTDNLARPPRAQAWRERTDEGQSETRSESAEKTPFYLSLTISHRTIPSFSGSSVQQELRLELFHVLQFVVERYMCLYHVIVCASVVCVYCGTRERVMERV